MRVMRRLVAMIAVVIVAASVYADGQRQARPAIAKTTAQATSGFIQTGRATYYHKTLRGMRTASGERYDYTSPASDFRCELVSDQHGLVLDYPGLAVRVQG